MGQLICTDCLAEPYLREQASDHDVGDCDYCDQNLPVIDMEELLELCETAIYDFFRPIQQPSSVIHHRYPPVGESLYDVLDRILGSDQRLVSDIHDPLLESWEDSDTDGDPYFVEETEASSEMTQGWRKMEYSLQFESRLATRWLGKCWPWFSTASKICVRQTTDLPS